MKKKTIRKRLAKPKRPLGRYLYEGDEGKVKPPKEPLVRIIEEGGTGEICNVCSSSIVVAFSIFGVNFRGNGCIQPECKNYHNKGVKR